MKVIFRTFKQSFEGSVQNFGKQYEKKVRSIFDQWSHLYFSLVSSSFHIQSVVIGVKYRNCCGTLDVYLLFAIWSLDEANSIKADLHNLYNYGLTSL